MMRFTGRFIPPSGRSQIPSRCRANDRCQPEQPIRQWVLTFPYPLRFLFAARPQVLSQVLGVVYRAISTYLIKKTEFTVASGHYRIAIGPNAGRKALTLRTVPVQPEPFPCTTPARQPGFSLHAATVCEAAQRDKLEKLCRTSHGPPSALVPRPR